METPSVLRRQPDMELVTEQHCTLYLYYYGEDDDLEPFLFTGFVVYHLIFYEWIDNHPKKTSTPFSRVWNCVLEAF